MEAKREISWMNDTLSVTLMTQMWLIILCKIKGIGQRA